MELYPPQLPLRHGIIATTKMLTATLLTTTAAATTATATTRSQLDMGPQSQRRVSQEKRTHNMQRANHGYQRKKKKVEDQLTLSSGEEEFDPQKHCQVCRARKLGGKSIHRAHHPKCPLNRKTKHLLKQSATHFKEDHEKEVRFLNNNNNNNNSQHVVSTNRVHSQTACAALQPVFVFIMPPPMGFFMPPQAHTPTVCCQKYQTWFMKNNRKGRPPHDFNCPVKALPNWS